MVWVPSQNSDALALEQRWRLHHCDDLHNDDALWAFTIRAKQEYELMRHQVNDPVIGRLCKMGIYDWTGLDAPLHQATRPLRHNTVFNLRTLKRVVDLEEKVGEFLLSVLVLKLNSSL